MVTGIRGLGLRYAMVRVSGTGAGAGASGGMGWTSGFPRMTIDDIGADFRGKRVLVRVDFNGAAAQALSCSLWG